MMRRVAGVGGGVCLGVLVALACAGTAEIPADGASGADGGTLSSFKAHATRGEYVPPDLDDVEHMCALLTGCEKLPIPPNLLPPDFASCVKRFTEEMTGPGGIEFSLTMRECGLQANSCSSLRSCALHGANTESCSGRGKQGFVGFCDVDGRALTCWHDQIVAVRDCGRGQEQCIVREGQSTCTLGTCPADIKEGDKPRCSPSGTHLLHCEKGKLASLDCDAFGLKCTTAADGTSACATQGPTCTAGVKRCDGNTAVGCFNGHEVRVDCASAGLVCSPTAGGTPVGACFAPAPPGGGCDPSSPAKCDGANVRYCVAGKQRSHFCKATGFNKCDTSRGGPHCTF
ncbi:MAG TPA: hypothetical protein VIF09_22320 [Polyangiaceae bacterium]